MSVVDDFVRAVERNAGCVVGPVTPSDAIDAVAERVTSIEAGPPGPAGSLESVATGAGPDPGEPLVAVPSADPVLDAHGIVAALAQRGVSLLEPDDPDWRIHLAAAPVGLTGALSAAAETGTVILDCGPGRPRSVSLLPDVHICVVDLSTLEATVDAAFERAVAGGVPSNLVWVSGPSRSADIEKKITLGVHGPRRFEVVLVG